MKRYLIIILISGAVLVAGYFLIKGQEIGFPKKETAKIKAIPIDAPLFIEISSLKNLPTDDEIIHGLNQSGFLNSFFSLALKIDTLITNSEAIGNAIRNESFIIVLNLEGRETVTPLLIADAGPAKKKKALEELIKLLFPPGSYQFSRRDYNGEKIFHFNNSRQGQSFAYTFSEGLFLSSPKTIIIEKAIRQLGSESLVTDKLFLKAHKTATQQAQASVYVNHRFFPPLIKNYVSQQTISITDEFGEIRRINHRNRMDDFANCCSWSEFDISSANHELQLNGVSVAPDSLNQYLSVFRRQEPARIQVDEALPKNTSMFYSLGFSNSRNFFEDLDNYFRHSDGFYKREEKIKKIQSTVRADIKQVFEDITDNEIGMGFLNVPGNPLEKTQCFIISGKGKSLAQEALLDWLKQYASRVEIEFSQLSSIYKIDGETSFVIYKFPYPSFPGIWLGAPFYSVEAKFFTFWDNYIIFTNTRQVLESLLHSLILDATLAEDAGYVQLRQKTENKANINLFIDVNRGYYLNNEFFSDEVTGLFKEREEWLRKFGSVNWQMINANRIYFNNICLAYPEKIEENAKTTWQSNIGAAIDFKPQLVINHNDHSHKEIILQDTENRLHLLTSEGRVRWSIQIPEKIIGEIHQVDIYRNGKLQYLFNTKSSLYVVDRNGNHVSPFPLALRSPATNGVNVFDYDNNHKYRFFVAGEDKKVYVYDNAGKVVTGWKFGQTDHPVTTPVQHFRVNGKDYIVFKDKSKIYVQDRRGRTRVDINAKFENSSDPIILDPAGRGRMITTDSEGNVYSLYFNGEYKLDETPGFSASHFFTACDIDGDNILDYIFADGDELTVLNGQGKKVFSKKIRNGISYRPNVYAFSQGLKKIGVVSRDENRIYLFNPDGSLHHGFPLAGNTEFSIGKISGETGYFSLIVGSNDGSLYNYRLY